MNRREFVARTAALSVSGSTLSDQLASSPVLRERPYSQMLPDMLALYFSGSLNWSAAEWDRKREQIRTSADLEARNAFVRRKAIEMLGGLPERTPLQSKTVRVLERPGYRVENLMSKADLISG
jgi:hypothetical protein